MYLGFAPNNASLFQELQYVYGTHIALKLAPSKKLAPFEIKKGCFEEISNQYSLMEIIFEFLHSTLNKCGYNRDKKDSTVISGIYDTTHSIYGTYCNYFVSSDDRLRKQISAIYYYLGVIIPGDQPMRRSAFSAWESPFSKCRT